MERATLRSAVDGFYAATSAMDQEAWVASFSPHGTSRPPEGAPATGREALRGLFRALTGAFDAVEMRPDEVTILGRTAVAYWSGCGVGRRGSEVAFYGVDVFEFDADAKIDLHWSCWDPSAVRARLQA